MGVAQGEPDNVELKVSRLLVHLFLLDSCDVLGSCVLLLDLFPNGLHPTGKGTPLSLNHRWSFRRACLSLDR